MTKSIFSKASVFATVSVFSLSVLISFASPAASAKLSVGSSFDQCKSNLGQASLSAIKKQYKPSMEKRLDIITRKYTTWIYDKHGNKDKYEQTLIELLTMYRGEGYKNKAEQKVAKVKANRDKALKSVKATSNPAYALPDLNDPKYSGPADSKIAEEKFSAAEKLVRSGVEATSSDSKKNKGQTVHAICKAVHEGAVYNSLLPYWRTQRIKNLTWKKELTLVYNLSNARAAKDVYEAKKNYVKDRKSLVYDTDGSLGVKVENAHKDSNDLQAELNSLSAAGAAVDVTNPKAYKEFYAKFQKWYIGQTENEKQSYDVYKEVMSSKISKKAN